MTFLKKTTFICLDCEFTGLDPEQDRIIEVAAVRFNLSENLDTFERLVDPECHISDESIAIHQITPEMIQGKPKMKEILPDLIKFIGNEMIIGHGIKFDLEMISRAANQAEIRHTLLSRITIDTLRLARLYGNSPNNSLESLARHFNIPVEGSHRAMNDVIMNIRVFRHLISRFNTVEQVLEVLSRPIKMKCMPLGKHKGRPFSEIPLPYLLWAAKMNYDQDLSYSIRLEIKKRNAGGGFSQASNPFSEL